jgi:EAL domain-containing protein (putative c-di-GMP-specific phosphodiesterase class I)
VNVSVAQLQQEDFGPRIVEILRKTGLPPNLLQLEMREEALDKHSTTAAKNLALLVERGVRITIDNWGNGDSSLTRLMAVPLHSVKLHREFLAGLEHNTRKQELVGAVVNLAHSIRMEVSAEGVESPEMLQRLQTQRFDAAQGYFIGRPMPAGRLSPILVAAQRREIAAAREPLTSRSA